MSTFIGIDLGTTYSAVSTIDQFGKPVILKNRVGEPLTPSVIYFGSDGEILVGSEAKERQAAGESDVAMFFKRNMGNSDFYLTFHNKSYTATDLSAILLQKLKEDAELVLGVSVSKAVITVPAYFNDLQRTETIKAAQKIGLEVLRILNEPTSAAIIYGMANTTQKVLVYDLGGGTFDVTVLSITSDSIQVLATGGEHELGGKDWDDKILEYMSGQFVNEFGDDPLDDMETYNDLAFKAETLKRQLTNSLISTFSITYNGNRGKYNLSRETFEELTKNLLYSTTFKANEILEEAALTWNDLDGILLVGGSTKMPMVCNWAREMSGKEPLRGINVDEAVCLGAAIQAQVEIEKLKPVYSIAGASQPKYSLAGSKIIADVMSHSLGLVAINVTNDKYINSIIIPKNKPVPSTESRPYQYKTTSTGSNELEVYFTQGEVDDVAKCIIVGKYVFDGIEHISRDKTIIDIQYSYDENGVISIMGQQRENGKYLVAHKCPLPDDMSWLYDKPVLNIPHLSVVIAIDLSGSMSGKPLAEAMKAAQNFIENMDLANVSIALVAFADKVKVLTKLTQNAKEITSGINDFKIVFDKNELSYGNGAQPFDKGFELLSNVSDSRFIIVLTDGVWYNQKAAIQKAKYCAENGIEIIAIGFGSADKKFLDTIATSNENALLINQDNLASSFGNIAQELTESGRLKMR